MTTPSEKLRTTFWTNKEEHSMAVKKAKSYDMSLSQLIRKLLRDLPECE